MSKFAAIAETILVNKILSDGFLVSKKSRAALVFMMCAALLGMVSIGFLIAAFHQYVLATLAPDLAYLATAGVAFVFMVIAALIATIITHKRQLHRQMVKHSITNDLQSIIASFDEELGDHVRENPTAAVALAAIAGFILADKVI